jgi:anti-sigma regulatory factor (Ser/Thr protein kinase)
MTNVEEARSWPDESRVTTHREHGSGHVLAAELFTDTDLSFVRAQCRTVLRDIGFGEPRASTFVYAINECLTNVIRHGGGHGWFILISDATRLVALIIDHGPGASMTIPEQEPANDAVHGRGLWLARLMVDRMALTTGPDGTTVRLEMAHTWSDERPVGESARGAEPSIHASAAIVVPPPKSRRTLGRETGASMSSTSEPMHLSNHHRNTLRQLFQHPVSHNIEWHAVVSLLETVGSVAEQHGGKLAVTLGDETEFLDPPTHKDIDTQMVVDLRRMLTNAGFGVDDGSRTDGAAES